MIQVVWFKRDLRTHDHAPLVEAASTGPVLPLYVVEPEYWRLPDVSTRQWMAQRSALVELQQRLSELGAPLIVRSGDVVEVLRKIHAALGIAQLLAHEETGNLWTFHRDIAVRGFCRSHAIAFREYSQTGLMRGRHARDHWAAGFSRFAAAPCLAEPERLSPVASAKILAIPTAADLGLPADECISPQSGTRAEGMALLESFLAGRGLDYRRGMSSPLTGANCCSRLSVSLCTGAISVREVLHRLYEARGLLMEEPPRDRAIPVTAIDSLIARLHWRSHFMQKLESEPAIEIRSVHPAHQAARSATPHDDPSLAAWACGQTGIPFVDACMRSLVATGWLNFRMRAMVQSFASYHLGLDWRISGEYLARFFVDYEPGIHWPQVQMQSGQTGINIPRIYNPVKQGRDHDPNGCFVYRWVPELEGVGVDLLHTPWLAPPFDRAGYCAPIVELSAAARLAKQRLTALRGSAGYQAAAYAVFQKHGSRKRRSETRTPRHQSEQPKAKTKPNDQLSLLFET